MSVGTAYFKSLQFIWKITNYSQQKVKNEPGKRITSQAFTAECESDLKFFLKFYPQGTGKSDDTEVTNCEKWTSLYLQAEGSKKYTNSHHVEFSILDADGEKFCIDHFHKKIPMNFGNSKYIRLTDLENPANNLLPNDTLTICCRVEETKSKTEGECNCLMDEPETRLGRDFAALLDDKFADFVFKVENEKIAAHKAILASRNQIFAAMFEHGTQKTNETEIKGMTPTAFKALIRFIYTSQQSWEFGTRTLGDSR